MFFETIAKFDTFQFICGTPNRRPLAGQIHWYPEHVPICLAENWVGITIDDLKGIRIQRAKRWRP